MLDKSIDAALLALRKQIIRGDGNGLAHVEALCLMRGLELRRVAPAQRKDAARKGETARLVIGALRDGPRSRADIVALLAASKPDLDHLTCYRRIDRAITKLQAKGAVRQCCKGVWGLAQ